MACHTSQQELQTGQDTSSLALLWRELETDDDVVAAVAVTVAVAAAVAAVAAVAVTSLSS